jgi:hypothetical protein
MPFQSKSQQRFMYAHKDDPSMKNADLKEWSAATDFKHLPEKKNTKKQFTYAKK